MLETPGHATGAGPGEVPGGPVTCGEGGTATDPAGPGNLSENALAKDTDRNNADGRFNVAEEVNFDQQSDTVRHAGNLPHQSSEGYGDMGTNEAIKVALQGDAEPATGKEKLDDSIKRAVPPSN